MKMIAIVGLVVAMGCSGTATRMDGGSTDDAVFTVAGPDGSVVTCAPDGGESPGCACEQRTEMACAADVHCDLPAAQAALAACKAGRLAQACMTGSECRSGLACCSVSQFCVVPICKTTCDGDCMSACCVGE